MFGIVESNLCFLRAPDVVISEWTEFVNIEVVEKRQKKLIVGMWVLSDIFIKFLQCNMLLSTKKNLVVCAWRT